MIQHKFCRFSKIIIFWQGINVDSRRHNFFNLNIIKLEYIFYNFFFIFLSEPFWGLIENHCN